MMCQTCSARWCREQQVCCVVWLRRPPWLPAHTDCSPRCSLQAKGPTLFAFARCNCTSLAAKRDYTITGLGLQFRPKSARIFGKMHGNHACIAPVPVRPSALGRALQRPAICAQMSLWGAAQALLARSPRNWWENGVQTASRTFAGHLWSVPGPAPRVLQKMGSKGLKNRACGARSTYFVGPAQSHMPEPHATKGTELPSLSHVSKSKLLKCTS